MEITKAVAEEEIMTEKEIEELLQLKKLGAMRLLLILKRAGLDTHESTSMPEDEIFKKSPIIGNSQTNAEILNGLEERDKNAFMVACELWWKEGEKENKLWKEVGKEQDEDPFQCFVWEMLIIKELGYEYVKRDPVCQKWGREKFGD